MGSLEQYSTHKTTVRLKLKSTTSFKTRTAPKESDALFVMRRESIGSLQVIKPKPNSHSCKILLTAFWFENYFNHKITSIVQEKKCCPSAWQCQTSYIKNKLGVGMGFGEMSINWEVLSIHFIWLILLHLVTIHFELWKSLKQ